MFKDYYVDLEKLLDDLTVKASMLLDFVIYYISRFRQTLLFLVRAAELVLDYVREVRHQLSKQPKFFQM